MSDQQMKQRYSLLVITKYFVSSFIGSMAASPVATTSLLCFPWLRKISSNIKMYLYFGNTQYREYDYLMSTTLQMKSYKHKSPFPQGFKHIWISPGVARWLHCCIRMNNTFVVTFSFGMDQVLLYHRTWGTIWTVLSW